MAGSKYDVVIVGAGFYGCYLALLLAEKGKSVLLVERGSEILTRASYNNQARVHNGYHYPRHFITALRSRVNFPKFVNRFQDAIYSDFNKYYAISKVFSKTNARQFYNFMTRVGAPIKKASGSVKSLFSTALIEEVFKVQEYAFNSSVLAEIIMEKIKSSKIDLVLNTEAVRINAGSEVTVDLKSGETESQVTAKFVFNCSYSRLNHLLTNSKMPINGLKHEITEMCLVETPESLKDFSVTVMCGPFFSLMPFPPRGLSTLSHVRYTVHKSWVDSKDNIMDPYVLMDRQKLQTHFPSMVKDSSRYIPLFNDLNYKDSLWEVKTTLISNESNDGRPIMFDPSSQDKRIINILGAKIDNVFELDDEVRKLVI